MKKPDDKLRRDTAATTDKAARRSTLKRLLAGGAVAGAAASLPSRWTEPVVRSVVLPAHAQTSPADLSDGVFFGEPVEDTGARRWLEKLVPTAHAAELGCEIVNGCVVLEDGMFTVRVLLEPDIDNGIGCFEGTGGFGQTITLGLVDGDDVECDLPTFTTVSLTGETPNRVLVVRDDEGEEYILNETNERCDCKSLAEDADID